MNFTNPLVVSSGTFPDQLKCRIMNTSMFANNYTGIKILPENTKFISNLPKQLPQGVSEEDIKAGA